MIWPRFVVTTGLAIGAYAIGMLAAWFETAVALGPLPAHQIASGVVLQAVFLPFAIAVVAAASTVGRSTLSTVGIALVVLLVVLPVTSMVRSVAAGLPTSLLTAPAELVSGAVIADYVKPVVVSVLATIVLLVFAVHRADRREL